MTKRASIHHYVPPSQFSEKIRPKTTVNLSYKPKMTGSSHFMASSPHPMHERRPLDDIFAALDRLSTTTAAQLANNEKSLAALCIQAETLDRYFDVLLTSLILPAPAKATAPAPIRHAYSDSTFSLQQASIPLSAPLSLMSTPTRFKPTIRSSTKYRKKRTSHSFAPTLSIILESPPMDDIFETLDRLLNRTTTQLRNNEKSLAPHHLPAQTLDRYFDTLMTSRSPTDPAKAPAPALIRHASSDVIPICHTHRQSAKLASNPTASPIILPASFTPTFIPLSSFIQSSLPLQHPSLRHLLFYEQELNSIYDYFVPPGTFFFDFRPYSSLQHPSRRHLFLYEARLFALVGSFSFQFYNILACLLSLWNEFFDLFSRLSS